MLRKIIKNLKRIMSNEDGFYVMAAMAAASMVSANSQKNAAMEAAAGDIKLQRAKMKRARARAAGDLATNTQRARESSQKREVNIEKSRLNAESKIDETFAGSGISGTSVDELDNELNSEVSQNKVDNKKALDQNLADQHRTARQTAENDATDSAQIGAGGPTGSSFVDQLTAGAEGAQQGAALSSALSSFKSSKPSTPKTSTQGVSSSLAIAPTSRRQIGSRMMP